MEPVPRTIVTPRCERIRGTSRRGGRRVGLGVGEAGDGVLIPSDDGGSTVAAFSRTNTERTIGSDEIGAFEEVALAGHGRSRRSQHAKLPYHRSDHQSASDVEDDGNLYRRIVGTRGSHEERSGQTVGRRASRCRGIDGEVDIGKDNPNRQPTYTGWTGSRRHGV